MLRIEIDEPIVSILRAHREAEKAADARVQEWQGQVKTGDCFKQTTTDGLEIFGEVLRGYNLPDRSNWRECRCFSFVCPEGEMGDVHVSQMDELIDRKTFESVRDKLGKAYRLAIERSKEKGFHLA